MIGILGNSVYSELLTGSFKARGKDCTYFKTSNIKPPWQKYINLFDKHYLSQCLVEQGLIDADSKLDSFLKNKTSVFVVSNIWIKLESNIRNNLIEVLRKFPYLFNNLARDEIKSISEDDLQDEFLAYVKETTKSFYHYRNAQNYNDLFTGLENFPIINLILESIDYEALKESKLLSLLLGSTKGCVNSALSQSDLRFLVLAFIGPVFEFDEEGFSKYLKNSLSIETVEQEIEFIELSNKSVKLSSASKSYDNKKLIITGSPNLGELDIKDNDILIYNSIVCHLNIDTEIDYQAFFLDDTVDPFYYLEFNGKSAKFYYVYQSLYGQDPKFYHEAAVDKLSNFFKAYYPQVNFEVENYQNIYEIWNEWDLSKSITGPRATNNISLKIWDKKSNLIHYHGSNANNKLSSFYFHFKIKNKFGL